MEDPKKVQTLLFSATLPSWVQTVRPFSNISIFTLYRELVNLLNLSCYYQIAARFLKQDKKTIDLVGNDKMKASNSVRHIALPCNKQAMSRLIPDIISLYSR